MTVLRERYATRFTRALLCALALSPFVLAQFVPIVAKQREESGVVNADGTRTALIVEEGTYMRASNGGEVRRLRTTVFNGKPAPKPIEHGHVLDSATGIWYTVDFVKNVAQAVCQRPLPLRPMKYTGVNALGQAAFHGIHCTLLPGYDGNNLHERIGTVCVARDLDLLVHSEGIFTPNEYSSHDLTDVQVNAEPDPNELRLPANVTVERPAQLPSCMIDATPRTRYLGGTHDALREAPQRQQVDELSARHTYALASPGSNRAVWSRENRPGSLLLLATMQTAPYAPGVFQSREQHFEMAALLLSVLFHNSRDRLTSSWVVPTGTTKDFSRLPSTGVLGYSRGGPYGTQSTARSALNVS